MQRIQTNKGDYHQPRIGIDLLGCGTSAKTLLKSILDYQWGMQFPPRLFFFGTQEVFSNENLSDNHVYIPVSEEIFMEDDPLIAVRRKKKSSLAVGLAYLKNYEIDAFITGGNSGALLAQATFSLESLPGIERPAFLTLIPSKLESIAVLDVGANIEMKAESLLQFAKMGIAFQKTRGISSPKVGLLNIGEEKKKGTAEHQKAYDILQILNINTPLDSPVFIGNIEGRNVFKGNLDVLVTDGFTGNIFLKTSQGIAGFVLEQLQSFKSWEAIPEMQPFLASLRQKLHYAEYSGAILCGLEGIIIKCHGESPPESFIRSIVNAARLVNHFFIQNIKRELSS